VIVVLKSVWYGSDKLFRDATIIDLTDEDDQNDPIQPEILEVDLEEDNLSVTSL
jgi:hypothetical protein